MNVEEITNVAVIGAGLMGHGIAQEFALAGYDVRLHDVNGEKLRKAGENIQSNLEMLTGIGLVTKDQADSSRRHLTLANSIEKPFCMTAVSTISLSFLNCGLAY